jgi:hypothetical protein
MRGMLHHASVDLLRERMHAQRLSRHDLKTPRDVVRALGAVQAQDLAGGLCAIAMRVGPSCTLADVEAAMERFEIVRTWPMRGTLHFVAAEDVHWMLAYGTPRVRKRAATRYKQLGLDAATFSKAERVLGKAMTGKKSVARPDVMAALDKGGVSTAGQRGIHIIGELAMRGVLCGGARVGKQHGFFLLDEVLPASKARRLDHAASLQELARRYFSSHGPATPQDFAWWAGILQHDAVVATNIVEGLAHHDGSFFFEADAHVQRAMPRALLLPPWDEYTVAYAPKGRGVVLDPRCARKAKPSDLLRPTVVIDGLVCGTWTKQGLNMLRKLDAAEQRAVDDAFTARPT